MIETHMHLILSLVIPLLAAFFVFVVRQENVRDSIVLLASTMLLINIFAIFDEVVFEGQKFTYKFFNMFQGIDFAFNIEPLGLIFAMVVAFLWVVTTLYSIGYMRGNKEANQTRFYACFAVAIFAALGIAFSANLITLFLFYEVLTICTYPLVTHSQTPEARKSGRVYLGILMGTSVMFLLPAILITLHYAGTLDFVKGGILSGEVSGAMVGLLLALYVFGIGKAALMPIHGWLPAAMVAPTPVSSLLHAVAVVKAGVFCIVKIIIYVFGVDFLHGEISKNMLYGGWLAYIAGFTIIVASIIALRQDNLKKRLAYSTISQLSYVIIAVAVLSHKAVIAAIFHIVAHAFGKITLFFAAGAIYTASHKKYVSQLSGIGRRMPWTLGAFTIGALSMIGVPPAVGFISKWYLVSGALDQEMVFVIIVVVASTLLNVGYFLPIIYKAFFEKEKPTTGIMINKLHGEAPLIMVVSMVVTASFVIVLFFVPDIFIKLAASTVN